MGFGPIVGRLAIVLGRGMSYSPAPVMWAKTQASATTMEH